MLGREQASKDLSIPPNTQERAGYSVRKHNYYTVRTAVLKLHFFLIVLLSINTHSLHATVMHFIF